MRVVWLSASANLGGAELALAEGVTALTSRGHEVHVILPIDGPLRARLSEAASIQVSSHDPWMTTGRHPLRAAWWLTYDFRVAAPRIRRIIRRVNADVVISNTITAIAGAIASRRITPHVWFLHEFGIEDHGFRFLLGRGVSTRLMTSLGAAFIVNSEVLRSHFAQWLPCDVIPVVHYAVDVPSELMSGARANASGPVRIILAGRKTASKGQHEAVASMALVVAAGCDVRLDLVGNGEPAYELTLRELIQNQGLDARVRLLPFTTGLLDLVAAADVALMCSKSEAFGRVTVEAMKLGKPVVATAAGANLELVRHGWNGYLYKAGAPDELADCIALLCREPKIRLDMGARGRAWAMRRFNSDAYGRALEGALEEACHVGVRIRDGGQTPGR